jgi:hypothetical protein
MMARGPNTTNSKEGRTAESTLIRVDILSYTRVHLLQTSIGIYIYQCNLSDASRRRDPCNDSFFQVLNVVIAMLYCVTDRERLSDKRCCLPLGNGSRTQRRFCSTKEATRASLVQAEVVDRVPLFGLFQGCVSSDRVCEWWYMSQA